MIRPVLAGGRAPAAKAAAWVVCGIFLGAWSDGGAAAAGCLLGVSAVGLGALAGLARGPAFRLAFASFWFSAGFVSGAVRIAEPSRAATRTFAAVPASRTGADVLEGRLTDFWSGRPPRARTTLAADRLWMPAAGSWQPFRAEITVFVSGETAVEGVASRGDRVRLTGRLEPEELPASERELALPWPRFRLSVKSARMVDRRGTTLLTLLTWPNRALFSALPAEPADAAYERDVRGPLAALLLGRTSELDRGMVARYRRGGLYHLLVVSGLHVVLEAGLVLALLGLAGVEGKRRDLVLLLSVLFFVLVGGANPPAVRAGLVVGTFLATRLLERPIGAAQAIGLSALVLFLGAPSTLFSVGTLLTFAAVCGIGAFSEPIRARLPSRPEWLWSGFAAALAAECATAPILFWRFNIVAAGAWLTAPLSVPLSAALIALGGALLVCHACGLAAWPLATLFGRGSRLLEWLAERAAGVAFLRPTPALAAVLAVGALLVAAALARPLLRRWAAAGAAAAFLAMAVRSGRPGPARGFSFEALDVGQGDAILLRWKRRAILVDGGGPFDPEATEFGRTRVLPKLLDRGVTRLDALLLTHPHPDHALGLFAVLEELPVGELWLSAGEDEGGFAARLAGLAAERGVRVRLLAAGERIMLEGANVTVLHSGGQRRKTDAINNQSAVLLVERDGRRALLTGDIGAPTETALVASGALPRVDALKVAHHGSRTSTTPVFLETARPRVAVLSCGRRNRFGHPAPVTLATLSRFGVVLLRTDERSDALVELLPTHTRLDWRGLARP